MEKLKNYCKKIFFIPVKYVLILSLVSFPSIIYALKNLNPMSLISIFLYVLSFYTLIVLCISLPHMYKRAKELVIGDELKFVTKIRSFLMGYKYSKMYLVDREFRAVVALHSGLLVNTIYAAYRFCSGFYYNSEWFVAIGIYYLIFGLIRYMLIKRMKIVDNLEFEKEKNYLGFKTYKLCGILMLILNSAMSIMIIQMVVNKKSYLYYGNVIYLTALYTFYYVISSINNMIRFAKNKKPILSASKNLTFAGALMSMFTLQTAMIAFFGENELERDIMNSITGAVVVISVVFLAIFMIFTGNKKIKEFWESAYYE